MATTQLHGIGTYTHRATLENVVEDFLGDHVNDFDIDGLTHAFREAINAELDGTTIVLIGDDFYSDYPARDDSRELIKAALKAVDLGSLASEFDTTE